MPKLKNRPPKYAQFKQYAVILHNKINKHEKLSSAAKAMLLSDAHTLHISIVSAWEVAIKVSLGKLLGLSDGVKTFLAKVETMPVSLLPVKSQKYVE